jgi:hypothetical protein
MWRNYRLSLSFANLIYLRAWADLVPLRSADLFPRKTIPGFNLYFALVGDVLALSLLIFLLICLAPGLPAWLRRVLPVAAIAMIAFAASFLRAHLLHYVPARLLGLSLALLFALTAVLAFKFSSTAIRLLKGAALAATPCLAVTFIAPLFYLSGPSRLPPDPPLAARLPGSPPVRVLWIVFDDWDQRLTFTDRAPGTRLPALDSLVDLSFAARRALSAEAGIPVFEMATVDAIPSLLYGTLTTDSLTEGPSIKRLFFAGSGTSTGSPSVIFGVGDHIFSRFRSQGWNSAIAGWYLPYCRVFAQLTDCYWDERYDQASSAGSAFPEAALDETRMLFETDMYSPFGRSLVDARHFAEYQALLAAARRYAADPSIGLAFIHFNIPHAPYFYNPEIRRFGRNGVPDDLYADALRWVDRAVGDIRSSLIQAGLDSKTAIIVSSDHPARLVGQLDPHIPFIVHLPEEQEGMFSNQEFSAIRTADLVMAIARRDIQTPVQVEKFLVDR